MDDIGRMFEEDADAVEIPTTEALQDVQNLALNQMELEQYIEVMEARLAVAKDDLQQIQERALPDLMKAINMKSFKLEDGSEIVIKDETYASVRAKFMDEAVQWLDANGLGGIVKDEVIAKFGREDLGAAKDLLEYLGANGYPNYTEKLSINANTLKATIKEQRKKGVDFPDEFFSIFDYRKATIKRPKGR